MLNGSSAFKPCAHQHPTRRVPQEVADTVAADNTLPVGKLFEKRLGCPAACGGGE
jgi:hypothetical protein